MGVDERRARGGGRGAARMRAPLLWPQWRTALYGFWRRTLHGPSLVLCVATSLPVDVSWYLSTPAPPCAITYRAKTNREGLER